MPPSPGAELARRYHHDVVAPLLRAALPALPHAAARLGSGSDVLGLDDTTSTDHDFGLRLTLLVDPEQVGEVDALLERELPRDFAGHPVRFATTWDPHVRHRVEVATVEEFAASRLGLDVTRHWEPEDWLALSGQAVLEVLAGPVFTDTDHRLGALRERLRWYPHDLWRHLVACCWRQLGQELPFVGRTGQRGDDLGSRVITARLVEVAVHLGFLLDRTWPPYPKWRGTLFATLPSAVALPALQAALTAGDWRARQEHLCAALEVLLRHQGDVGLPAAGPASEPFHARPFRSVPQAVLDALTAAITDERVRALPAGIGSIEQWTANVDVLVHGRRRHRAARAVQR
ncbi:DUF4037 domain-containing protein [Kineococcus indalonis]|uniref:DUF4037 domain-containing protein n=1 Tax=Kineococcus indalonis TaxID=2696566 RepID=UPI001411CA42|nr:DUF4037 domain-containing protein [Kineococcus indalonis]NAZ85157.1 DUF4037 domain-containing protein [Kineococcus indalonis]